MVACSWALQAARLSSALGNMSDYLYPTTKGRIGLIVCLTYIIVGASIPHWLPGVYSPVSDDPALATEQILSRSFQLAILITLVSIPPAALVGWGHFNALETRTWPSLGNYIPFKVKVRKLQNTKEVWISLIVFEALFITGITLAWAHHIYLYRLLSGT